MALAARVQSQGEGLWCCGLGWLLLLLLLALLWPCLVAWTAGVLQMLVAVVLALLLLLLLPLLPLLDLQRLQPQVLVLVLWLLQPAAVCCSGAAAAWPVGWSPWWGLEAAG